MDYRTIHTGTDIMDRPEDERVSLQTMKSDIEDTFQAVGIDDYTAVDRVIGRNGRDYFATRFA